MCIRHGVPYFSVSDRIDTLKFNINALILKMVFAFTPLLLQQFSPSTEFVVYICTKILPNYSLLEAQQSGIDLEVLQSLAEISPFISPNVEAKEIENCQEAVFSQLLNYIPKPPEDLQTESSDNNELPSTQFSHVECLLYIFHQLCKFNPTYFSETKAEIFKDFKLRLQYLARGM